MRGGKHEEPAHQPRQPWVNDAAEQHVVRGLHLFRTCAACRREREYAHADAGRGAGAGMRAAERYTRQGGEWRRQATHPCTKANTVSTRITSVRAMSPCSCEQQARRVACDPRATEATGALSTQPLVLGPKSPHRWDSPHRWRHFRPKIMTRFGNTKPYYYGWLSGFGSVATPGCGLRAHATQLHGEAERHAL